MTNNDRSNKSVKKMPLPFKSGDRQILIDALYFLSARERKIVHLRFWEDLSITEISLRLRVEGDDTVKILDNALTKLKIQCLANPQFSISPLRPSKNASDVDEKREAWLYAV